MVYGCFYSTPDAYLNLPRAFVLLTPPSLFTYSVFTQFSLFLITLNRGKCCVVWYETAYLSILFLSNYGWSCPVDLTLVKFIPQWIVNSSCLLVKNKETVWLWYTAIYRWTDIQDLNIAATYHVTQSQRDTIGPIKPSPFSIVYNERSPSINPRHLFFQISCLLYATNTLYIFFPLKCFWPRICFWLAERWLKRKRVIFFSSWLLKSWNWIVGKLYVPESETNPTKL